MSSEHLKMMLCYIVEKKKDAVEVKTHISNQEYVKQSAF